MRRFLAVVVAVGAGLALAGSVTARPSSGGSRRLPGLAIALPWSGLSVGVNDDSAKNASLRDWFFPAMHSVGMRLDTLTVNWDESDPSAIPARLELADAITAAQANGVAIELDLYPLHSRAFTRGQRCKVSADPETCGDGGRIGEFAAWAAQVARTFPTVHQFVVMNECNQPRFVNPQWNMAGQNQSAAICGRALAAAYDAIKTADRANFVWGIGLSPRGNDAPRAATNSSTSPVRFLADLGAWFKAFTNATHRAAPLMDGFDFHPYPVPQSLPFATGYANTNDATVANLPRIYQAFYDAFAGTRQRTIGSQRGGGLPVSLNETGIQTGSSGPENVRWQRTATTAGGVRKRWATEDYQARWYLAMLDTVACDPDVRLVNVFHLLDESDLGGWQSGLFFADETPKLSASAVRNWITSTGATCRGRQSTWKPGRTFRPPIADLSKLKLPGSISLPLTVGKAPTGNGSPIADGAGTATAGDASTSAPSSDSPSPAETPPPADQPPN
jgi:hypothetical protein